MSVSHEAVEGLYRQLGPGLLAYARSLVRDRGEAEDVLQQVFVKLMTAPSDAWPREPRPYLFRAVRNTCLNRRRSTRRETERIETAPMFNAPNGRLDLAADLEAALQGLPDEQREVVMLRLWGEMTTEATAEVLGVSANTVASRYRYALVKLRQHFGAAVRT
jgi:RNA polymerase sigma-70 factor, ECF subfamily